MLTECQRYAWYTLKESEAPKTMKRHRGIVAANIADGVGNGSRMSLCLLSDTCPD